RGQRGRRRWRWRPERNGRRRRRVSALLDLRFLELDVLAGDRVVLAKAQLLGLRPRILLGDIEKARVGAADELDLDGCRLGHGSIPIEKRKAAAAASSRGVQWRNEVILSTDARP